MNKQFWKGIFIDLGLLLLVCLIAYLPLSSFLFSLKNDAYIYNFPNKFFFSTCLHQGILPLWNPYLNYGFPLFADPGFAWWHPITWLFGIIGYNAYTFTIEVLLYIYISGLGMYWLGRKIHLSRSTAIAIGCMYMCSGFFVGNLQHINFLTGAAFLPWVVAFWLLYQWTPTFKHLLYSSIAIYLICTSGHPAIPIATIYFMLAITILYYLQNRKVISLKWFLIVQLKLFLVAIVILLPLIFSYLKLLPYYTRFSPNNQIDYLKLGFSFPSYISFLFPFATIKNPFWFDTDVSMRNAYFSLVGIICFIRFLYKKNKLNIQKLFFYPGLLLLLLALGGMTKKILFESLPALALIRTNGEFRVFAIFSFIICAAFEMEHLINDREKTISTFKTHFKILAIVSLVGIVTVSIALPLNQFFIFSIHQDTSRAFIKDLIDHITFEQSIILALFCAFILSLSYFATFKNGKNKNALLIILITDLIINCWLLLPITGVNKTTAKKMQTIFNKSPKGFPAPTTLLTTTEITEDEKKLIGNWGWYDKKIYHENKIEYPSILTTTEKFFASADTTLIKNKPFVFTKNQGSNNIEIVQYTPNSLELKIHLARPDTLIILQNNFPGWQAFINGKRVPIIIYAQTFIAVAVTEKSQTFQLYFRPH